MQPCTELECEKKIDDRLHSVINDPEGIIKRLEKQVDWIKENMFIKPKLYAYVGAFVTLGIMVIAAGYNLYSSEYRYATRDQMILHAKEQTQKFEQVVSDISRNREKEGVNETNIAIVKEYVKDIKISFDNMAIEQKKEREEYLKQMERLVRRNNSDDKNKGG